MSIMELGALGEFVGAFAVVITLIYLAVQLRQNTTSIQTSSYQEWAALHADTMVGLQDKELAEIVFRGCEDSKQLDEESYPLFMIWVRRYMHMQQAQFYLYQKGAIEHALWEKSLEDLVGVFRYPGVQQLWHAGLRTAFTDEFVEVLEHSDNFATMMFWDKERGFYPSPYHS